MKIIRTYGNYICVLLVLIVLNVSIDIPDELLYRPHQQNASELNELESITEFVFEACLDEEGSFPETEGDDEGSETYKKENNWKPALHNSTSSFIASSLFNTFNNVFIESYAGANYAVVPDAPPCSA